MQPHMENPALAARGVPNSDLASALICSEYATSVHDLQARRLTRRCAISLAMASIVAPLLHGEVA